MLRKLGRTRFARQTGIYLFGTIANRVFPFVLIPIYTRSMPPHEFGKWGFAMAVLSLILYVSDLGLNSSMTRFYYDHKDSEARHNFLILSFLLRLFVATSTAVVLFVPLYLLWPLLAGPDIEAIPFVPIILACASVQAIVSFNLALSRAQRNARAFVQIQIAQTVLQSLIGVVLVLAGFGATGPLYGLLGGQAIVGAVIGVRFFRTHWTAHRLEWGQARANLAYGIKTVPTNLSVWLKRMADRVIIGRFVSFEALGSYQLAASGIAPLTIIVGSFNSAYLPYYYEKRKKGTDSLPLIASLDMSVVMALTSLSIAAMAIAPELFRFLAPPVYGGASTLAPPLILGAFLGGCAMQFNKELFFHKQPGTASVVMTLPALVGVGANLLLVPRYGAVAAAWTSVLTASVSFAGSIAMTRRIERTGHQLGRLALACSVVGLFALVMAEWAPVVPFEVEGLAIRLLGGAAAIGLAALFLLPTNLARVIAAVR